METPEEKNEENLPENVVGNPALKNEIDKLEQSHDPDQHTSPLKEILVDDTPLKPTLFIVFDPVLYPKLDNIKFCRTKSNSYVFEDDDAFLECEKHPSITRALNMINYLPLSINIECIGSGKFRITKN